MLASRWMEATSLWRRGITSPTGSQSNRPAGVLSEMGRRCALTACLPLQGTLPTSSLHSATTCCRQHAVSYWGSKWGC